MLLPNYYFSIMTTNRLEAFSDGVFAIIITIMVLEMKAPHNASLAALKPLIPVFISYIISFTYVGIYWNNHHHMLHMTKEINGSALWANLHLLFWLSLTPFTSAWMGENGFSKWPMIVYSFTLLMCSISYIILASILMKQNPKLQKVFGTDSKGKISMLCYVAAIGGGFISSWISLALVVIVATIWVVPDRRIERKMSNHEFDD